MPNLNVNQQKAVDTTGKNIIVSASAGTGKTTVLINRLIKMMVGDHISIDRVLVMSFTTAAAQEIKDRLALRLEEEAAKGENQEFLFEQIAKLPTAPISTIDAFCLDIVKKYGYVLGIDPLATGNVMSESDTLLFKKKAMDEVLRDLGNYQDLVRVMCPRIEDYSPIEKAINTISNTFDGLSSIEDYKLKVKEIYKQFDDNVVPSLLEDGLKDMLLLESGKALHQLMVLEQEYDIISSHLSANYRDTLKDIKEVVLEIENDIKASEYEQASLLASTSFKFPVIKGLGKEDKKNVDDGKKKFREALAPIKSFSVSQFCHLNKQLRPYVHQIIELTEKYRNNFKRIKKENQTIDFVDMEEMALEILRKDNNNIARIYRSQFHEIMVDEYQDSSMGQEELVKLLTNGKNVFRVGDVKQSIYGFRNAKPELMIGLINNLTEDDVKLNLYENYRSKNNIIMFTNYIFTVLMNIHEDNTFNDDDCLSSGTAEQQQENKPILIQNVDTSNYKGRKLKNKIICNYVARSIKDLHDKQGIKYNEFAILVRNNGNKGLIKDSLAALNIPSFATYSEGFFNDPAVSTVVSLLNLLLEDDDIYLLDLLRGPIFNVSDEEIARMYVSDPDSSLREKAEKHKPETCQLIDELRSYYPSHTLCELISKIYQYENWYYYNISIAQRDNLDSLYNDVIAYEADDSVLSNLVQYLNSQSKADKAEALSVTKKDEVVRIMTIHQSKGLEFNYLYFIDFSNRKSQNRDGFFTVDDKLGISADLITLPYRIQYENTYVKLIRKKKQLDELDEELRLLYVALTRAKIQLTILCSDEKDRTTQPLSLSFLMQNDSTYVNWILKALEHCPDEIRSLFRYETVTPGEYVASAGNKLLVQPIEKYSEDALVMETSQLPSNHETGLFDLNYDRIAGSTRGTLMHKAIELLGIREVDEQDIRNLRLNLSERDIKLVKQFYENELTRKLFNNTNHNEWPFMYVENNFFHNGIIDLLSENDQESYLIDFKTDKNVTEEILQERYQSQLRAYHDVLADRNDGRTINTMIYSFHLGKYVEIKL